MRALITGITGQDGAYLANFLTSRRYEVHGLVRSHSPNFQNLNHFHLTPQITFHLGDVSSPEDMVRVVSMGFDEIYNLAAQSFVGTSWDTPHHCQRLRPPPHPRSHPQTLPQDPLLPSQHLRNVRQLPRAPI